MKDIIIVGISNAGRLHLQSYNKLKEKGRIFLVDNQKEDNELKIYKTIGEVLKENKLNSDDVVVDICTPKDIFYQIIDECINLNIKNILVEKPFILKKDFIEKHKDLKLIMVQNYLYSKILGDMKRYILENKLEVKSIYTNFSKNRIQESIKGRGMSKGKVTRNIEIEMPHQIYIANYLAGDYKEDNVLLLEEKDLCYEDIVLPKHGYSKIICIKDNVIVTHISDLTTNIVTREVIVICSTNIVIKGEFLVYDKKCNLTKLGKMEVLKDGIEIFQRKYEKDDNIYENIKDAYNYFNSKNIDKKYEERLSKFGKEFSKYMEM